MMKLNLISLTKDDTFRIKAFDYDRNDSNKSLPFINYILEDKSKYPYINTVYNERIKRNYVDEDLDFKIGNSGGLLMNIDFVFVNVEEFSKTALFYEEHGSYCLHEKNSVEYKRFWANETQKRRQGMTANCKLSFVDILEYYNPKTTEKRKKELLQPLHITGDHYTYLNYGRIERTPNIKERQLLDKQGLFKVETVEAFPRFWDGDYWAYKALQFCDINKLNIVIGKARRKGYSYKNGNGTANLINLNKTVTVINVADDLKYLTDPGSLTYMCKTNLDWFENNTYWRRGYLSESLDSLELGYKKKTEGNKPYGYRSKLLSYSIGVNTSAAVGKKGININVEEAGKCPKMQEFLDVTMSNLESGQIQIGGFRIWGTGGTKGANWQYFEKVYYNPDSINAVAFENVWDENKRHEVCGFFHSQIWNYEPYVVDGNSLLFDSFIEDKKDKDRAKKNKSNSEYIIHCAQRANTPSEAFINTTENIYASANLNVHISDLKNDHSKQFYTDGWYIRDKGVAKFVSKEYCINNKILDTWHDFIIDVPHTANTDIHGCVREYFPPYTINGVIPEDLYFITVDPYGVDKKQSEITDKHSLYSFQVWMRDNGIAPYSGKRLVAEYTGRLNTMRENDDLLLLACLRWRAKTLVEANRGETITNFKKWKFINLLLHDPTEFLDNSINTGSKNTSLGMIVGNGDTKLNGLTSIKDFIYEIRGKNENEEILYRLNEIYSLPLCLEFQRFTSTGNFDRISTTILAMYEFRKDEIIKRMNLFNKAIHTNNNNTQSFYERLSKK